MNDLFDRGDRQLGFDLGEPDAAPCYTPDPADIRAELTRVLAVARAATDAAPWDRRTFLYHKTVFPQMARWLEADERDQLCFDFAREIARIAMLMAA